MKRFLLKIADFQLSLVSVVRGKANDAVVYEQVFFSENHVITSFSHLKVNTYVLIYIYINTNTSKGLSRDIHSYTLHMTHINMYICILGKF